MNAQTWEKLTDLFDLVYFDTPLTDREARLMEVCAGDPDLERELRRLIAAAEDKGPLDNPMDLSTVGFAGQAYGAALGFVAHSLVGGRFLLLRLIGQGGMGQVWEALDQHLGVKRALKTIRPEVAADPAMIDRFKREVKRSQEVTHPHVCRVYDLYHEGNIPFLSMELLLGESLAQRLKRIGAGAVLPKAEAQTILEQCASALDAANSAGLAHRDFKPANVMLVNEDHGRLRAVVTDFGLALPIASGTDAVSTPGAGTPAYMPPEQAGGLEVSSSADVYSFGVVACELFTGKRPSEGGLDLLPRGRQSAFRLCIDPDPTRRPVSCQKFLDQLTAGFPRKYAVIAGLVAAGVLASWSFFSSGSKLPPAPSIAIVPFSDADAAGDGRFVSQSFADGVSARLASQPGLRLVPAASASQFLTYRGRIAEFAKRVDALYLLTGSVRTEGQRVLVRVQLVDPGTNRAFWAQNFDRPATELPQIESSVASAALAQMGIGGVAPDVPAAVMKIEADRAVRLGRFHYSRRDPESVLKARDQFLSAIRMEPRWASPQIGLAQTLLTLAERNDRLPSLALPEARAAIDRALALDPRSAEALATDGYLAAVHDRDFAHSERSFQSAIRLDPNNVLAHQWYSNILVRERRFEEALRESAIALRLDPLSIATYQNRAAILIYAGKCRDVLELTARLADLSPESYLPSIFNGYCHAQLGHTAEARSALDHSLAASKPPTMVLRLAAESYLTLGDHSRAADLIARLTSLHQTSSPSTPASYIAFLHAANGSHNEAFAWMERAWKQGDTFLSLLHAYPACAPLRSDPRYRPFLTRLGIRENMGSGSSPSQR